MDKVQKKNLYLHNVFVSKRDLKRPLEDSATQEGLLIYESRSQTRA
jgi:hypothetical protein